MRLSRGHGDGLFLFSVEVLQQVCKNQFYPLKVDFFGFETPVAEETRRPRREPMQSPSLTR